ncbi:hypothetical protein [Streptomyces sp. NPDC004296]|uniref:hypothetical protein n=1 Tax=Streptomyces sp. NPDC004296 TaxID=3364697 RepID=UPI00367AC72A
MNAERPAVGDLVMHVLTDARWVCSDISRAKTDRPVWVMRPLHGGEKHLRVDHRDIVSYSIEARRGEWTRP